MTKAQSIKTGLAKLIFSVIAFVLLVDRIAAAGTITPDSTTKDVTGLVKTLNTTYKITLDEEGLRFTKTLRNLFIIRDSIPLCLELYDTFGQPLQGLVCTLTVKSKESMTLERVSDDFGQVLFWVPPPKAFRKFEFTVHPNQPVSFSTNVTMDDWVDPSLGFQTGEGLLEMKNGVVKVLYPEGYELQAMEVMAALKEGKKIIDSITQMNLEPLKIIMSDRQGVIHLGGWASRLEPEDSDKYGTWPHEWVEGST
jgi:hypothetical protein